VSLLRLRWSLREGRRRWIQIVGVVNNELEVVGGLKSGDVIATAGVAFLHDGMKVKLLDPADLQ